MSDSMQKPFFTGITQPDGQQFDAWANQPLLLSMEAGGIDWPGLSADEKADGYVLPCVAHPCSDVTLRYEGF